MRPLATPPASRRPPGQRPCGLQPSSQSWDGLPSYLSFCSPCCPPPRRTGAEGNTRPEPGMKDHRLASLLSAMVAHCVKVSPLLCAAFRHSVNLSSVARNATSQSLRCKARVAASSCFRFLEPGGRPLPRRRGRTTTGCCVVASFICRHLCRRNGFRATVLFRFLQRVVAQQLANNVRVQSPHPGAQLVGG